MGSKIEEIVKTVVDAVVEALEIERKTADVAELAKELGVDAKPVVDWKRAKAYIAVKAADREAVIPFNALYEDYRATGAYLVITSDEGGFMKAVCKDDDADLECRIAKALKEKGFEVYKYLGGYGIDATKYDIAVKVGEKGKAKAFLVIATKPCHEDDDP